MRAWRVRLETLWACQTKLKTLELRRPMERQAQAEARVSQAQKRV